MVGAGHVGLYAALRLSKKLKKGEAEVTVVDPNPHMTYQPFLPEAAAGNISPRHSVVPLRRELRRCHVLAGEVTRIEHARKVATVQPIIGPAREVEYDQIVVAPGSVSRTLPIPGLREQAVGFKTIGEAIYLRNQVLDQLDVAATTTDPDTRGAALTFVFIGGGYAGIEALAEMEDMARDALRYYPELKADQMHWVLVEATMRILPEVDPDMGAYTVKQLLRAQPRHPAGYPAGVLCRRDRQAVGRRLLRGRHDRVDGRGQGEPDAGQHRPAARREGPAHLPGHPPGGGARPGSRWTAPGRPGTAPPYRT